MKGKAKWLMFVSVMLVLSLFLAACGGGNNNSSSSGSKTSGKLADKQVLKLTEAADLPTLDAAMSTDTTSGDVLQMISAGLMMIDDNKVKPDMAASEPEVSKDGKVYTFKIRDNAKWSDGSPVTAQDFVYAWQRAIDPKTASQYAYIFASANIKNAEKIDDKNSDLYGKVDQLGVKAIDDHTLQVTLEKPTPYFTSLMSFPTFQPLKKDFFEKQGDKYAQEPDKMLYNGPFVLATWNHGSGWTLKKNPNYWDAKNITLDEVDYNIVKDTTTNVNLYKTNKIDLTGLSADYVNLYKDKPDFHNVPGNCVFFLKLNVKKVPALKNVKVRQAIAESIDRENMVNVLLNNGSLPAHYYVPKDFTKGPDGKDFRDVAPKGYLLKGQKDAKKLWAEAKKELGIKNLNLEYVTTDNDLSGKMAEYIADQISKTLDGVKVTINKQPWNQYLKMDNNGDFDIGGGSGWCPDYQDPMTFLDYFTSTNSGDTGGWVDKHYDDLIKKANNLGNNPAERWKVMQEAEQYLVEQAPVVPTYQKGSAVVVKPYVKGIVFQSYGSSIDYRHAKIYQQ
ncbi:peptide ABC transporter substrate-binding protein [Camelliibacillus cellulosilyticus]|uniref:Peptide ABC transporter substrate-binding protein n=1 Tax=Camelliibacillus cellulosilyticus TaxID=2174486 RepID=A0ABV9GS57_9BACL